MMRLRLTRAPRREFVINRRETYPRVFAWVKHEFARSPMTLDKVEALLEKMHPGSLEELDGTISVLEHWNQHVDIIPKDTKQDEDFFDLTCQWCSRSTDLYRFLEHHYARCWSIIHDDRVRSGLLPPPKRTVSMDVDEYSNE